MLFQPYNQIVLIIIELIPNGVSYRINNETFTGSCLWLFYSYFIHVEKIKTILSTLFTIQKYTRVHSIVYYLLDINFIPYIAFLLSEPRPNALLIYHCPLIS